MMRLLIIAILLLVLAAVALPYTKYGVSTYQSLTTPHYVGNGCTYKFELPGPPPPENADRDTWQADDDLVRRLYAINVAHYGSACTPPPTAENQHMPVRSIK